MLTAQPSQLMLQANDIHLWMTRPQLINQTNLLERYKSLLTADETTKQQRYHFPKDRHNALITRAFVRDLLSHYADIKPAEWRFEKGAHDKPEIINPPLPLRFNLSHTKEMIICIVTLNDDIGCDVETISRNNDTKAIAAHYFSSEEASELLNNPEEDQRSRFFDYWTLKESYIKAWGQGLNIPLQDFSFQIGVSDSTYHNNDIRLSFAPDRMDQPVVWRSWLFYPDTEHTIAFSIKASSNNQTRQYQIRYFYSIPLISTEELAWPVGY